MIYKKLFGFGWILYTKVLLLSFIILRMDGYTSGVESPLAVFGQGFASSTARSNSMITRIRITTNMGGGDVSTKNYPEH